MATLADPGRGGKLEVARARARALRAHALLPTGRRLKTVGQLGWVSCSAGPQLGRLGGLQSEAR